jgi:adenylosuccinate lyase
MSIDRTVYRDPLVSRYTSREMQHLFSEEFKFRTWKRCWIALAEAEHELGLAVVTPEKIAELQAHQDVILYEEAEKKEAEIRHDVMSHVHAYGLQAPLAKGIIHLGATSQFVGCNTELMQMREATKIITRNLVRLVHNLAHWADQYQGLATLAYTHYQPAQPTTVGKRFTLYIQDLLADLDAVEALTFRARSVRGTTGTHASFKDLFDGDYAKVRKLEQLVAQKLGFDQVCDVTGQTYPRKFDTKVAEALAGIGVSLYRFAGDLRLLSNQKVVDEPFALRQTGSSAMPYKRNPMRAERLCSLARKLTGLVPDFYATAQQQWFERTLDDSAIRRMDIPQLFLLAEAVELVALDITQPQVDPAQGRPLTFYPNRIKQQLAEELPFMAVERILMDLVKAGHDRQEMHELLKEHAVAVGIAIKEEGRGNDLFARLAADQRFPFRAAQLQKYLDAPEEYTGFAAQQTRDYLSEVVRPRLARSTGPGGKLHSTAKNV